MDTDVSHEVEKRLSRLEEKVGINSEGEEVQPAESDAEDDDTEASDGDSDSE